MAAQQPSGAGLPDLFGTEATLEFADRLRLFGQFVGAWDMRVRFFDEDGATVFDGPGLWEFAWILDGRAIQDTLSYDEAERFPAPAGQRRIGTTIRSYHQSSDTWHQVWVSPRAELFIAMQASAADEGILITGLDMDGSRLRWAFTDITAESFIWTGRSSADGESWRIEQVMVAQRRQV